MDFYRILEGMTYQTVNLNETGDEIEKVETLRSDEREIIPTATYDFVMKYLKQWADDKNVEFGNDIFTWRTREFKFDGHGGGIVSFISDMETIYCRFERYIPEEDETEEEKS